MDTNKVVSKCMRVILGCQNTEQLSVAMTYADLVYKHIYNITEFDSDAQINSLINDISLIEMSIGYILCQIKNVKF